MLVLRRLFLIGVVPWLYATSLKAPTTIAKAPRSFKEDTIPGGPPGFPDAIAFPTPGWGFSKPKPKPSSQHASPLTLNLVQFFHWMSFPVGFALFWTIFENASVLSSKMSNTKPMLGPFFCMLGHVCQVFGPLGPIGMHHYEGWQVAEFRNPLETPKVEMAGFNDAWLRAVMYRILFTFQSLGLLFTAAAAYGLDSIEMKAFAAVNVVGLFVAPELPHTGTLLQTTFTNIGLGDFWNWMTRGGQPVFPLTIYIFCVFLLDVIVSFFAYNELFGAIDWKGAPFLGVLSMFLPSWLVSSLPILVVTAGGVFEGLVAETSFNQNHHLIAIMLLDLGLLCFLPYYWKLGTHLVA